MQKTTYTVPTANSEGRANTIRDGLAKLTGVQRVDVDYGKHEVSVEYDEHLVGIDAVYDQLIRLGFPPESGRRAA